MLGIPIPALILFCCAAAMVLMAVRRFRAGQRGRALFNLMLAAFMAHVFVIVIMGRSWNK